MIESEPERLSRLYAGLSDQQLEDLAKQPEDLTDEARLALAQEMRSRGFVPPQPQSEHGSTLPPGHEPARESGLGPSIPGIVPGGAEAVETALEPGGDTRSGMATLVALYDGLQLGKACAALEEAKLDFAIQEIAGEPSSGVPGHFEIWVQTPDLPFGRSVLRDKMGLFPQAEEHEFSEPGPNDPGSIDPDRNDGDSYSEDLVVASFTSIAEAEDTRALLAAAGFSAHVESDDLNPEESTVLVPAAEQERALDHLATHLGLN